MSYEALVECACGILQREYGNAGSTRVDEYSWNVDVSFLDKCCNLSLSVEGIEFNLRFELNGSHLLSREISENDPDRFMSYCLASLFAQSIREAAGIQVDEGNLGQGFFNESTVGSYVCFDIDLSIVVRQTGSGEGAN